MNRRQLVALFLCSLIPWTIGNGVLPLLPVYAAKLGADPAVAGYYMAISYLALALGTIVAGWLSDRLQRRKLLFILAGAACIPTLWLMGRVADIWLLTVLTAATWFFGGMGLSLASILTGLFAEESERGKIFAILGLTSGLGALIGGMTTGPIADRWGYGTMFAVLALFVVLWPLVGLFLQDKEIKHHGKEASTGEERVGLGKSFYFLLLAGFTASVANFVGILGRSMAMDGLGYTATAIAAAGAVSGGIFLPLLPFVGWLSDRVGRKRFLVLSYVTGTLGLLALVASVSLWHFWVASMLMAIFATLNGSVGSALVADLVDQRALGKGMSLFSAVGWVGGIIGLAGAGYAIQRLGMAPTLIAGASLTVVALILLIPIRRIGWEKRESR